MIAEVFDVIVFVNALQCLFDVLFLCQITESRYQRHVLSNELIDQASFADLEVGIFEICGTHIGYEARRDLLLVGDGLDLMNVKFTVEQILVRPLAARLEQFVAFCFEGFVFIRFTLGIKALSSFSFNFSMASSLLENWDLDFCEVTVKLPSSLMEAPSLS